MNAVCLTPRRPVRIEKPTWKLAVRTAQSLNGRWDYGIDLNILTEGHSCGAGFIDDPEKGFPTEKEAIYACLLDASEDVSRKIGILEKQGDTPDDYEDDEGDFALFRPNSKAGIALPFRRLVGWEYKQAFKDPLLQTREMLGILAEQVSRDFGIDLHSVRFKRDEEGRLTEILLNYEERADSQSAHGNPQPEGERK